MNGLCHVHFTGIGGIHMSGLASILLADGGSVSGSDLTRSHLTDALAARGASIFIGHHASQVARATLVVRTVAVKDDNPEIIAARQGGIEVINRAQLVARLAQGQATLTVGGTHGKTTTATMLTLILREAGLDPTYILGGESPDLGAHAARGQGGQIVVEADEYARAFHEYQPSIAVITNVERDHLDYYGNDHALQAAFAGYGETLVEGGTLIVGADSAGAMDVTRQIHMARSDITVETFSVTAPANWCAQDVQEGASRTRFVLERDGAWQAEIELRVPGVFNVHNALAAIASGVLSGASINSARAALGRFRGVQRRFQRIGEVGGVLVLDDYAHHPTEIAATVRAARTRFPGRRLIVLFQPHTYSRSAYLLEGFQRCFQAIDLLYLTDTYAAREEPEAGLTAIDLAARISEPRTIYAGPLQSAADTVSEHLQHGDVLFTMGAGDVASAAPLILHRLERTVPG